MLFVDIVATATAFGSLGTALGLIYLAKQANEAKNQFELSYQLSILESHNRLSDMAFMLDRYFMENPDSWRYFYDSQSHYTVSGKDRAALRSGAEFVNDIIENIMMHDHFLSDALIGNWTVYCQEFLHTSPLLREFLHCHKYWYGPSVGELLKAVQGDPYYVKWPDHIVRDYEEAADETSCATLFEASFPAAQMEPFEFVFHEPESNKRILVLRDKTDVIGLAVIYLLRKVDSAYLKYICIDESRQGHGLGSTFMREVELFSMDQGREHLFLDIEIPMSGKPDSQASLREMFYQRLGYNPAADGLQFRIPDVSGGPPLPMRLLKRRLCGDGQSADMHIQIADIFHSCFDWFTAEQIRPLVQDVCP